MSTDSHDHDRSKKRKRTSDTRQRPRRGGFRWYVALVLLALAVFFLPTIVAKTPLRDMLISWFMPSDRVSLAIGDVSLGWFSPPVLTDVRMQDAVGQPLLSAETIRLERSTWQLATNSRDLGTISIVRPTLYITLRADGSNWQDAVKDLLSGLVKEDEGPGAATASEPVRGTVKLIEGVIVAQDGVTGLQWRIDSLNFEYQLPAGASDPGRLSAAGRIESRSPVPRPRRAALPSRWDRPATGGNK